MITTVTMVFKKETKRTYQFTEEGDDMTQQDIGSMYIKQARFTDEQKSNIANVRIKVSVEVAD